MVKVEISAFNTWKGFARDTRTTPFHSRYITTPFSFEGSQLFFSLPWRERSLLQSTSTHPPSPTLPFCWAWPPHASGPSNIRRRRRRKRRSKRGRRRAGGESGGGGRRERRGWFRLDVLKAPWIYSWILLDKEEDIEKERKNSNRQTEIQTDRKLK